MKRFVMLNLLWGFACFGLAAQTPAGQTPSAPQTAPKPTQGPQHLAPERVRAALEPPGAPADGTHPIGLAPGQSVVAGTLHTTVGQSMIGFQCPPDQYPWHLAPAADASPLGIWPTLADGTPVPPNWIGTANRWVAVAHTHTTPGQLTPTEQADPSRCQAPPHTCHYLVLVRLALPHE